MNTLTATITTIFVAAEAAYNNARRVTEMVLVSGGGARIRVRYICAEGRPTIIPTMPTLDRELTAQEADAAIQMGTDGNFYLVIPQGPVVRFQDAEAAEVVLDHTFAAI